MTVDDLISAACRAKTGPVIASAFSPESVGDALRFALGYLLDDIDYDADPASGAAVAARLLAAMIAGADELQGKSTAMH